MTNTSVYVYTWINTFVSKQPTQCKPNNPSIQHPITNNMIKLYIHTLERACFQRVLDVCIQGVPAANPPHLKPFESKVYFHVRTSNLNTTFLTPTYTRQFNSSINHHSINKQLMQTNKTHNVRFSARISIE